MTRSRAQSGPPASDRVRARVVVGGRVQGVWFRESCREQAVALALGGWVRNHADGSVEAVFEGAEASVERAVQWCRMGPAHARVDAIDVQREIPIGEVTFNVR